MHKIPQTKPKPTVPSTSVRMRTIVYNNELMKNNFNNNNI